MNPGTTLATSLCNAALKRRKNNPCRHKLTQSPWPNGCVQGIPLSGWLHITIPANMALISRQVCFHQASWPAFRCRLKCKKRLKMASGPIDGPKRQPGFFPTALRSPLPTVCPNELTLAWRPSLGAPPLNACLHGQQLLWWT